MSEQDYAMRYGLFVTVGVRGQTGLDYHGSTIESVTLHFPLDVDSGDVEHKIPQALATVLRRFNAKQARQEAERIVREASVGELREALDIVRERRRHEHPGAT